MNQASIKIIVARLSETAGLDPWSSAMLKYIHKVIPKVKGDLSGMGSEDGFPIEKSKVAPLLKAMKSAGYKATGPDEDGAYIVFYKNTKAKGFSISPCEDEEDLSLNWFDEDM